MLGKRKRMPQHPGVARIFRDGDPKNRLHAPKDNDLLQAIDLQQIYQIGFWDALVVQSATCLGCKQLFSEDLDHGQVYGEVQVINPFREKI
jgi:predicted nucleic acid-binding protein